MKTQKIKYWTACVGRYATVTHTGMPFTNLRDAIRAKKCLNSSNACVVRANEREMPTNEVVA